MKRRTAGKLGKDAPIIGSRAAGQEPQAKPSPTALAGGKPEPEWTQGPWAAYDRGIGWEVVVPDLRFGTRRLNDGHRETFTEADAHLVAAAPDMYYALDNAMRLLRDVWRANPNHPIWTNGPAALAKARGEKPESTSTEDDEGAQAGTRSQDS